MLSRSNQGLTMKGAIQIQLTWFMFSHLLEITSLQNSFITTRFLWYLGWSCLSVSLRSAIWLDRSNVQNFSFNKLVDLLLWACVWKWFIQHNYDMNSVSVVDLEHLQLLKKDPHLTISHRKISQNINENISIYLGHRRRIPWAKNSCWKFTCKC